MWTRTEFRERGSIKYKSIKAEKKYFKGIFNNSTENLNALTQYKAKILATFAWFSYSFIRNADFNCFPRKSFNKIFKHESSKDISIFIFMYMYKIFVIFQIADFHCIPIIIDLIKMN